MPAMLVFAIIFVVIAIFAAASKRRNARRVKLAEVETGDNKPKKRDHHGNRTDYSVDLLLRDIMKWVSPISLALAILFLVIGSLSIVPTKQVGVVTSFGKPVGTLSNGLHFVAPWQKVTQFDAAIQTDTREDDAKSNQCTSTKVRLANQSTACVDNSIRWRIKPDAADDLYRDYRDFDKVRDSLVTRQLNAALTSVLATYDPLASLNSDGKLDANYDTLSKQVQERLTESVDDQIEVLSVLIPLVNYDPGTQSKIDLFQAEMANTRIAEQRKQTATKEAQANNALKASVSKDPNVLVSKCLDTLNDMVKARRPVPAGFSCWPGSQSAVVVPSAKR